MDDHQKMVWCKSTNKPQRALTYLTTNTSRPHPSTGECLYPPLGGETLYKCLSLEIERLVEKVFSIDDFSGIVVISTKATEVAATNSSKEQAMGKNDLRQQAEEKWSKRKKSVATEIDTLRLIHELEVHQIELEMQNDELLQAKAELEATLSLYAELYAFASVGYFTLTRDGTICRANYTGAELMGVELSELIKRRFALFVSPASRLTFSTFLDEVFTSGSKKICEVAVQKDGYAPLRVQIEAISDTSDGQELCYAKVDDITSLKAREQLSVISGESLITDN